MKIVVGIATAGRAPVLAEILRDLRGQIRQPDEIIVCAPSDEDMQGAAEAFPGVRLITGPRGLTRQRNAILAAVPNADVVMFFDDDFLAEAHYLQAVERHMETNARTVVVTGAVLADGIKGPGLDIAEGRAILAARGEDYGPSGPEPVFTGYGCNMALRLAPMRAFGLSFDERLPLYGWQEDVDLSRRLAAHGDVRLLPDARGVHLGVKRGRSSGIKLGYSQVANPLYIAAKKEGYPRTRAWEHIIRNLLSNIVKAIRPEPYIDRRGRLVGNMLAFFDLVRGRMTPERAATL
ncbi:glycosyl transferase [Gluconacetobacter liquefaciens]|uniref:GT2 family glycosyltransferase n=1 Tax=Gluconacetobacter liquefaciens TaxID=89584 RepID=A0A370G042_GLULI|nr:glycosyltransferase [Gluconacetobacter liquefaciens]MBB2187144.1 glycosyltransferase family 2 protein [Gluconacetobacter liquefaciens]RDI37122.1 GT2 family glycosyltransferase [Gluconacetobacter liquefaciens]GEB37869.1 glycosyl transferase [Gluconacetobacter liquefaciens]